MHQIREIWTGSMWRSRQRLLLQKPIFIHLRFYLLGEGFKGVAEVSDQFHILSVHAFVIHFALVIATLKVGSDVVETGVDGSEPHPSPPRRGGQIALKPFPLGRERVG